MRRCFFFFQAEDGIRDIGVTGVQTCALPIWGGPDFSFRNDMEHALLIKASYTSSTLTFSFYGTDEGRRVVSSTSEKTNWREPKLTYALDPAAPAGSVRAQRGSPQQGFDVAGLRPVAKHGEVASKE